MAGIKRTVFSLRVNGHTFELVVTRLDKVSYRIFKQKHHFPKSLFYKPERWEYGLDLHRRRFSLHHKRDL